jgi:CheY-like chemotaxis protein
MKPRQILLAEDDADDRELFVEAIGVIDPSISVATVDNGEQLMDHLKQSPFIPDCIFLDLNMPRKNGKECLAEIRADNRTRAIPVIVYTTSFNAKDVDETFNRGAFLFVRKPNSFADLKSILSKCMSSGFDTSAESPLKANFILR